jgi:hypothetical protein
VGLRFGDLTPGEFGQIVEGFRRREERDWYRSAWMVAYFLAPHVKRKVTPEKLLGWSPASRRRKTTPAPDEE